MPYLYKPPTYKQTAMMEGSLRYYVDVSTSVYRISGVWHNVQSPGMSNPSPADCDVDAATGLRLYWNKPMVIPLTLQPELAAWGIGTLTLL